MNDRQRDNWWDYTFFLEDMAERLLHDAMMYRKHGHCVDSEKTADEMEECAWAMLDVVHYDCEVNGAQQAAMDKFTEILRTKVNRWWD